MLQMIHIVQVIRILTEKFGTVQMTIIGPAGEIVSEIFLLVLFSIKIV